MSTIHPNFSSFKRHFCCALQTMGVFAYVNAKSPDVCVPEKYKWDSYLPLILRREDCYVEDNTIVAALTFEGKSQTCRIPLTAIFAYGQANGHKARNELL